MTDPAQPMTSEQTREVLAAVATARGEGRVVLAVEFPRWLGLAPGPWSVDGVDLFFHSWYTNGFNLKLAGIGAFEHDDRFVEFTEAALSPHQLQAAVDAQRRWAGLDAAPHTRPPARR